LGTHTHYSVAVKDFPFEADFSLVVSGERRELWEATLTFRGKIRRDKVGRVRIDYQADAKSELTPEMAYIVDQDAGLMTVIDPESKTAYATRSKRAESVEAPGWIFPGRPRQPSGALGWSEVEGLRCRRLVLEGGHHGGETRVAGEVWVADELVLVVYEKLTTDSGQSECRLSNIRRGESDPSLFAVPPGSTIIELGGK
jgi:hypothetical protein